MTDGATLRLVKPSSELGVSEPPPKFGVEAIDKSWGLF